MSFKIDKIEHRELSDDSKIVNILGYFWSLPEEDQKQVLQILNDGKTPVKKEKK